jgi:hypothetical protein
MPDLGYSHLFAPRNWLILIAALSLFKTGPPAFAQSDSSAGSQDASTGSSLGKAAADLHLGPFDLHPRVSAGLTYDDNILYSAANKEADTEWLFRPALQAVVGDDAALVSYRDRRINTLEISPGSLIVQPPEDWPGTFLILDYGPGFQIFDKYTANNSIDQFATVDLLWPMGRWIWGLKADYRLEKVAIIEADQRTTVETIPTTISGAYQLGDKASLEADFGRVSTGYATSRLTGSTEYNTQDWFNYLAEPSLAFSAGVLAGLDEVAKHQDQNYLQLRARARYLFTEKLAFDASAGGEWREYENGSPDTLSPVFTVSASYLPAARTTLSLVAFRQQYAVIFNGYNYASTGATADLRQEITDRFSVDLSAGYYSLDYTRASLPVTSYHAGYYTARISFEARIIRHLTGQIFSQLVSSHADVSSDVNEHQAGVQLTLSY